MGSTEKRGGEIRHFNVAHVEAHPVDIVAVAAETFGVSRQAVHRHIQRLMHDQVLESEGTTRNRRYKLRVRAEVLKHYILSAIQGEDVVWRQDIRPLLDDLPQNGIDILQYGLTEMLNNVLEHSGGHNAIVHVTRTATETRVTITDDGEGIFKKLKRELGLADERHAVLELAKGKVTTDPAHHTGEGIFFTSRMVDDFMIVSGNVMFMHLPKGGTLPEPMDVVQQDVVQQGRYFHQGTIVVIILKNTVARTPKEVFDQFTSEGECGFTKTMIPVSLAQYGDEKLVSRSQAKRLLAGLERFKVVCLDFEGVETIGQAFADEVFRVFVNDYPDIEVVATGRNAHVTNMIRHVAGGRTEAILGFRRAWPTPRPYGHAG
jgi:anti-sigma regulatory factor (Ser/Thr protein kinase)